MIFPKKYIKQGKFVLHSGQTSDVFYDVISFLTDNMRMIYHHIITYHQATMWIGIATGGALIACQNAKFGIVHNKKYYGNKKERYILIDDVVTTEASIKEAIKVIGKQPKDIFCVVDRRKIKTLNIKSMYQV